jgi:hypothetical protein
MTDLEKIVNDALRESETAKTEAARKLAEEKRKAAMEQVNIAIMRIGRLVSLLKSFDKPTV